MKYIIQIFTGGWHNQNYTPEQIIGRLETVTSRIPVQSVILGWNINRELYKTVNTYLSSKQIESFLWLPVFSEISELFPGPQTVDIFGQKTQNLVLQEGENFAFSCPSSAQNIENVKRVYEEYFGGCGFDGVFLDKIRGQSFVGGTTGVLSCGCENCRQRFLQNGLDLNTLKKVYETKKDHLFDTQGYQPGKGFLFSDPAAEQFFTVKSEIIAEQVNTLCRWFHARGMKTGLDLYAPLLSRFTGQDYALITEEADFIKPMMYRRTEAPAGIGYEYTLLKECIPQADGYPDIHTDEAFLNRQLAEMKDLPVSVYPGIEINYREDIARTDPEYIRASLQAVRDCGMAGAVLAWDVMLAPDEHLDALI